MIKPLFMNVNLDAEIVFAASKGEGVDPFFAVCQRMGISVKEAGARYMILKARPAAYQAKVMKRVQEMQDEQAKNTP